MPLVATLAVLTMAPLLALLGMAAPLGLIIVAALVAGYRTNELPFHLKRALENGVTQDEPVERITHRALYAGWPSASTAVGIARQVFAESAR